MSQNEYAKTFVEYVHLDEVMEISLESFQELLENMNFGEKINGPTSVFSQWREDYYWELEKVCQEMFQEQFSN